MDVKNNMDIKNKLIVKLNTLKGMRLFKSHKNVSEGIILTLREGLKAEVIGNNIFIKGDVIIQDDDSSGDAENQKFLKEYKMKEKALRDEAYRQGLSSYDGGSVVKSLER